MEAMNRDRWRRIDELVRVTLELEQSQRAAFLDQSCPDEPEIRAEVEALVAADEQADGFLEEPAVRRRAGAPGPAVDLASGEQASGPGEGWRIGPYRVIRSLGEGGMGAVYLAARSDAEYDRAVAIKVLRPGLQSRAMVRRFRSERQILASLDHPNIARLHDGGTMPDGRPYLVMEYIDGTPIDRHVEQQGLDIRARVELFRRICDAVQYAHQNLVVHLDIKPGNILVTRDGVPKLLDFGIARLLDPEDSSHGGETHTGLRPLTPMYASPEQMRGQPLTTASDVYSLGLVLYKLLTGRLPHSRTGAEPTRPSMPDARTLPGPRPATKADQDDPPAPATRRDARWRRQLAGDLDSIVLKALREEPQRRYGSAEQLSADLERYLSGRPVEARKGTTLYRLGKLLRRHRLAVAAAATILALVIAFAASTAIQAARLAEERRRADQQRQNTEEVLSFLISVFQVADPFNGEGSTATAKSLLDEGARRLDQELHRQPEVQARLRETFGTIYLSLGSYDQAATLLRQALQQTEKLAGPEGDELQVAAILTRLATVHLFRGEHAEAEPLYARALDIRQRRLPADHIDMAESLHNLASCYFFQNQMDRARPLYERALAISRGRASENKLETAYIIGALAGVYRAQKDLARAEPLYREAIQIYQAEYGDEHPDVAYGWNNLAQVYIDMGDLERAAPLLERAAQVVEKLQGAQHPQLATILYNHGRVLQRQGDLARAEQLYLRALHIIEDSMGRDHAEICDPLGRLLELYTGASRTSDAEALRVRFSPARLEACPAPRG